jgi:hypothetical protein
VAAKPRKNEITATRDIHIDVENADENLATFILEETERPDLPEIDTT